MGRIGKFETRIDDLRTFDISFLKEHGYLKETFKSGIINWISNNQKVASANISTTISSSQFVKLSYTINQETEVNDIINLQTVPSNLGKGVLWYFVCPITKRRCRKLYLYQGHFVSRFALPNLLYESQCYSKTDRSTISDLRKLFNHDDIARNVFKKNAKNFYNGKPTKKYQKYLDFE